MSRLVAVLLCIAVCFSLVGCGEKMYSLTREETESFVDKSYYEKIEEEKKQTSGINLLIPFSSVTLTESSEHQGLPSSLFSNFPVLYEFRGKQEFVYVNGKKYKKSKELTLTVLMQTEDLEFTVWPTIVIIKHGVQSGEKIYRSIRTWPDTLKLLQCDDFAEDAEFGDGYFGYSVGISCKESHGVTPASYYMELFSAEFTFESVGHYTVAVVDSYKNNGKYTDNLLLQIK